MFSATTLLIRVVRNIDFWRGNYRDKDMPRYDLSIAIFDTIRYIVPSLLLCKLVCSMTGRCRTDNKQQLTLIHVCKLKQWHRHEVCWHARCCTSLVWQLSGKQTLGKNTAGLLLSRASQTAGHTSLHTLTALCCAAVVQGPSGVKRHSDDYGTACQCGCVAYCMYADSHKSNSKYWKNEFKCMSQTSNFWTLLNNTN